MKAASGRSAATFPTIHRAGSNRRERGVLRRQVRGFRFGSGGASTTVTSGLGGPCSARSAHLAATDETMTRRAGPRCGARRRQGRGIEVGHIFSSGPNIRQHGHVGADRGRRPGPSADGSYGIGGVGRRAARSIEASHDDVGIVCRRACAVPGRADNVRAGDAACDAACDDLYARLEGAWVETPTTTTATNAAAPSLRRWT